MSYRETSRESECKEQGLWRATACRERQQQDGSGYLSCIPSTNLNEAVRCPATHHEMTVEMKMEVPE